MAETRCMSETDLAECVERGRHVYLKYYPYVDIEAMRQACLANWDSPSLFMVRTDDAFGMATIDMTMTEPRPWAREQWAFSLGGPWQLISIYRAMLAWAERVGAFRFTFGSSTEYDLSDIARRLGPHVVRKTYDFEIME